MDKQISLKLQFNISNMKTHKDLDVWKNSINFVSNVYKITANFPDEEKFGLSSQMRRAAVSIPSNIAEGAARGTSREYIRFLHISLGSCSELETQLIISKNLEILTEKQFGTLVLELETIIRMLVKLIRYFKNH